MHKESDIVVIGGGPGGYNAAFRAADLGQKVILVERYASLGGVCLNVGCIPSKSLLHVAESLLGIQELNELGITKITKAKVDIKKLREFKEKVVGDLTKGLAALAKQRKVEVIHGVAKFTSSTSIEVRQGEETSQIDFKNAIIASGSRVIEIPNFPNDDPRLIDSTGALDLAKLPKNMLIVGGGIIGLEMAEVYSALGCKITIVELMEQLIPPADKDLVAALHKRISGFSSIYLKTKVLEIKAEEEYLKVSLEGEQAPSSADFDMVLVAVGRRPNGDLVGVENAGLELSDHGFIEVNEQQQSKQLNIYAIGDVVGPPMLAHKAAHEGIVAAEAIAGHKVAFAPMCIPSVAYTNPEIAWAGLTEKEAKEANIPYTKGIFPWAASGRAHSIQEKAGKTKLLFHKETKRIIGGGIVGAHAGELISEVSLAIEMGADALDIGKTIHPHPTLGETIGFAAEAAEGVVTEIYVPKSKNI